MPTSMTDWTFRLLWSGILSPNKALQDTFQVCTEISAMCVPPSKILREATGLDGNCLLTCCPCLEAGLQTDSTRKIILWLHRAYVESITKGNPECLCFKAFTSWLMMKNTQGDVLEWSGIFSACIKALLIIANNFQKLLLLGTTYSVISTSLIFL